MILIKEYSNSCARGYPRVKEIVFWKELDYYTPLKQIVSPIAPVDNMGLFFLNYSFSFRAESFESK